jgi:hypothetical protein
MDPIGESAIKAAIDQLASKKQVDVSPVYFVARMAGLLKFAQTVSPNPMLDNTINVLSQFSGRDTVTANATLVPRGMVTRLSIDEGVLRAAGTAAKSGRAQPGF